MNPPGGSIQTYTVKSGDSLSAIARRLGVPLHLLIEVNSITDTNRIRAGQLLRVPGITTDTAEHPEPPTGPAPAPAPGAPAVNRDRFHLPPSQYVREETDKDLIVLHFTAGATAQGAFASWTGTEARVAAAYILDLDGTVYELFDPRFWAFHLGVKGAASQNFRHDRRSIGIEIVNVGPLKERDGALWWWPDDFRTRWCGLRDTSRYVKRVYRGFTHYAAYTPAQAAALGPLVAHLQGRFGIPKRLPALAQRPAAAPAGYFKDFSGVASHQNFRLDKFDAGPAFDWRWVSV